MARKTQTRLAKRVRKSTKTKLTNKPKKGDKQVGLHKPETSEPSVKAPVRRTSARVTEQTKKTRTEKPTKGVKPNSTKSTTSKPAVKPRGSKRNESTEYQNEQALLWDLLRYNETNFVHLMVQVLIGVEEINVLDEFEKGGLESVITEFKTLFNQEKNLSLNGEITNLWFIFDKVGRYKQGFRDTKKAYLQREWSYIFKELEMQKRAFRFGRSIINYYNSNFTPTENITEYNEKSMQNSLQKITEPKTIHELSEPFSELTIIPENNKSFTATLIYPMEDDIVVSGNQEIKIMQVEDGDLTYSLRINDKIIARATEYYFGKHQAKQYYLVLTGGATFKIKPMYFEQRD